MDILPLGDQTDHFCISYVGIAPRGTGKHDYLTLLARGCDGGAHGLEALGIAPTQGVIDDHGHAPVIRAYDSGARNSAQDAKLLLSPGAKFFYIKRGALECATYYSQLFVKLLPQKVGPNTMRPNWSIRSLKGSM